MKPEFIDHIVLIVADVKKTVDFYSLFLGEPDQINDQQVVFKVGETKIFFGLPYGHHEKYEKDNTGLNHLAFGVSAVDELKELEARLNIGGIKHGGVQIDMYGGKEFIWFDDPDGYRIEFYLRR